MIRHNNPVISVREMGTLSESHHSSGRIHANLSPSLLALLFFLSKLEKRAKLLTHAGGLHEIPPSLPHDLSRCWSSETVIVLTLKIGLQTSLLVQRILSKLLLHGSGDITEFNFSIHSSVCISPKIRLLLRSNNGNWDNYGIDFWWQILANQSTVWDTVEIFCETTFSMEKYLRNSTEISICSQCNNYCCSLRETEQNMCNVLNIFIICILPYFPVKKKNIYIYI